MNKKKWLVLAAIIGGIALLVWLVVSGAVKPSDQTAPPAVEPAPTSTIPPAQGLVEQETGVEATGPTYVPTADDMKAWLAPLVSFDTNTQTYDQWHEYADSHITYTPQDFPKSSVGDIAPSAGEWSEGWKRDFQPSVATPLEPFKGQGGAVVRTWTVGGDQMLYGPDGEPWIGTYNEINVTAQCAGSTPDTCRVLSYDSEYPIHFAQEKALYTP